MENVDGTAIHYELQKENPYWKLHVARFNAVGKEFYNEYFHDDTIHTEANCFTKLWKKALPDIVVDDHGVPTHEWEQQFSGYTSPSYKGFWLPRSLLYGYFWYVSDEKYRSNYAVNKALEEFSKLTGLAKGAVSDAPASAAGNVEDLAKENKAAQKAKYDKPLQNFFEENCQYFRGASSGHHRSRFNQRNSAMLSTSPQAARSAESGGTNASVPWAGLCLPICQFWSVITPQENSAVPHLWRNSGVCVSPILRCRF